MSPVIILSIAVTALRRNAMRTALTALGMIIGVAAVIVMVAIGHGAQSSIEDRIRSAGTNVVTISSGSNTLGPVRQGFGNTTTLTSEDARAIAREVPGIDYLSPGVNTRQQVVAEAANWNTQIQGAGADLAAIRAWSIEFGSFFTEQDVTRAEKIAVLGGVARDQLFGPGTDPTGATIRIRNQPFRVAGVLARKADLDREIARVARNWSIGRMPVIDRNILRIGAFELLAEEGAPRGVVINEAIELAKRFSTAESGRFINGILDKIGRAEDDAPDKKEG